MKRLFSVLLFAGTIPASLLFGDAAADASWTYWMPMPVGGLSARLFPYGEPEAGIAPAPGEAFVARADDASVAISWSGAGPAGSSLVMPYYGKSYTSFNLNNNGLVSFAGAVSAWDAPASLIVAGNPLIAPFWGDVDTRDTWSGRISYRTVQDAATLANLGVQFSNAFSGGTLSFTPTFAQVATWNHVGVYNLKSGVRDQSTYPYGDATNTFQMILASDGVDTYAMFLYPKKSSSGGGYAWRSGLNWLKGDASTAFPGAGFGSGDTASTLLAGSGTADMANLSEWGNTAGIASPGVHVYKINGAQILSPGDTIPDIPWAQWSGGGGNWAQGSSGWNGATWNNGQNASFADASPGTLTLTGPVTLNILAITGSGYTFTAAAAANSLQFNNLLLDDGQYATFGGSLVVLTNQPGTITGGTLIFRDTATLVARRGDAVTGGVLSLRDSAQILLYDTDALSGATLVFDKSAGGTGGTLDLRGLSTAVSGVRADSGGVVTNSGATPVVLTVGGSVNDADGAFAGVIQDGAGGLSLVKSGLAALTLSGANTYTGGTTVNAGVLRAGSASGLRSGTNAAYTVNGGTLDLAGYALTMTSLAGAGGAITLGPATLTVNQSSDTGYAGGISGAGAFIKSGAGALTLSGTGAFGGTLSVNAGTLAITGSVTAGGLAAIAGNGGNATLNVSGAGANWTNLADILIGHNGGSGNLNITGGATASDTFALVGRTAGGTGNVVVSGAGSTWTHSAGLVIGTGGDGTMAVSAGAQVSNTDGTLGGDAGSSGGVIVTGANSLWTSTSYLVVGGAGAGALTVASGGAVKVGATGTGMLTLGNAGAGSGILNIGAASGDIATGAGTVLAGTVAGGSGTGVKTVNFNHTGAGYTFASNLTGNLNVVQNAGTTVLTGNNTFSGGTTINAGTLRITDVGAGKSSLGTGAVLVNAGGTLAGSGTILGNTVVAGTLAPGNSPGLMIFAGDVTLAPGASLVFQIAGSGRGAGYDAIDVAGILTFAGTLHVELLDGYAPGVGDTFRLFDAAGGYAGGFEATVFSDSGYTGSLDYATGTLTFVAVPEPALWGLPGAGALAMTAFVKRRKR